MAKNTYIGVSNVARKVKNIYIGVNGVARKVKKAWIGVGGVAREFWSGGAVVLTVGTNYTLGGYTWRCCEVGEGYAILTCTQSLGTGTWPTYPNRYEIAGQNISSYNSTTSSVYSAISRAEKTGMSFGNGLYLLTKAQAESTSSQYNIALRGVGFAWLGELYGSGGYPNVWIVVSSGDLSQVNQSFTAGNVVPTFNLDTTKVTLSGNALTVI